MNKKLDLTIVEAIKSIIADSDCSVQYTIHKGIETQAFKKVKREVTEVKITLMKEI